MYAIKLEYASIMKQLQDNYVPIIVCNYFIIVLASNIPTNN
jgi:hypothetical protein